MLLLKQYQRDSAQLVRMSERLFATSTTQCSEDAGKRRNFDAQTILDDEKKGVFRVLQIGKPKDGGKRQLRRRGGSMIPPPQRADMMKPDQAWGDVWPAARTFHPAVVPLPVRQGVVQQKAQVSVFYSSFLHHFFVLAPGGAQQTRQRRADEGPQLPPPEPARGEPALRRPGQVML